MKIRKYSPTYAAILDLLFHARLEKAPVYKCEQDDSRFTHTATGDETIRLNHDFYVAASELWGKCTTHEWYMVGRISSELKTCNALWLCSKETKNSSANRKAINGLVNHGVLVRTETTDIYLVNPRFVRRGDFVVVLSTTAELLSECDKVNVDHVVNKRPVREHDATVARALLGLN